MKSLISKVLNKIVFILIKLNIIKPKSIFYMGGVNILPPPLSAEEEMELLQQLETDDSIKQILIERNLRLVVYISRKFENTGIDIEDLISIGTIGLIKAVNTFKLNKNIKLATYASRCIENEILMYLRKNNKKKIEVSFDEPLNIDVDGNELLLSDVLGTDLGVSKYVLSRLFSKTFHRNFNQYLNGARLNYACHRLENTSDSITNICLDSGFESQRTFNRVFKERYKISPSDYRSICVKEMLS